MGEGGSKRSTLLLAMRGLAHGRPREKREDLPLLVACTVLSTMSVHSPPLRVSPTFRNNNNNNNNCIFHS